MIGKKIKQLRNKFYRFNIDGYIIPKNDEFFSEYSAINRLKIISNFDGTAGLAIVLRKKNYLLQSYYFYPDLVFFCKFMREE